MKSGSGGASEGGLKSSPSLAVGTSSLCASFRVKKKIKAMSHDIAFINHKKMKP